MDEEVVNRDLVHAFVKLLKDTEAEVRTAIAGQIPGNTHFNLLLINLTCVQDSVAYWTARPFLMKS